MAQSPQTFDQRDPDAPLSYSALIDLFDEMADDANAILSLPVAQIAPRVQQLRWRLRVLSEIAADAQAGRDPFHTQIEA